MIVEDLLWHLNQIVSLWDNQVNLDLDGSVATLRPATSTAVEERAVVEVDSFTAQLSASLTSGFIALHFEEAIRPHASTTYNYVTM